MAERVDHWLRLNAASRVPRRLIALNAQARSERSRRQVRYTFRCAAGTLDLLDVDGVVEEEHEPARFDDAAALWEWVASCTAPSHRTVAYAYNLSYFLRLTDALQHLTDAGWTASRVVLNDYSCWSRFTKGKRSLYLCDLRSWVPVTPSLIAGDLNRPAPRQPKQGADNAAWERYAVRNAELVRAAARNLMRWLREDDLGDFRTTGAAQASAAFRHRFLEPRTILVHWGGGTRDDERRSAWTGRAEVWRPGKHAGPLVEYDYTAAYAWLAEHERLPTRLLGPLAAMPRKTMPELGESRAGLYAVEVTTETPVLPALLDGRIVWPVGSFSTVVWDVELAVAIAEGAQVTITRGWLYETAPVLREWARWVLACLAGEVPTIDPLRRRVVKAWSRSLIGRFGLRYPELVHIRDEPSSHVRISTVHDNDKGRGVREVQIGRQVFEADGEVDGNDSAPQVMAAVMAHARVRLWRTMRAAGLEHVFYVDTDSVLVDLAGAERIDARLRQGHFPGLRRKATYTRCDLRAPRQIELDDVRRVAGLPKDAWRREGDTFEADVWEGIEQSLRRRRPSGVFRLHRTFTVAGKDFRRLHLPDGSSAPLRLAGGIRVD